MLYSEIDTFFVRRKFNLFTRTGVYWFSQPEAASLRCIHPEKNAHLYPHNATARSG